MKTQVLFPNRFKKIGWMILIPSAILGILIVFEVVKLAFLDNVKLFSIYAGDFEKTNLCFVQKNISNEIFGILCVIGAILVAFSKEKNEDEFIAKIRMESLVWAIYVNYIILIFCMLFFISFGFMYVMIFNMYTILIFSIIRFNFLLHQSKKAMTNEK